MTTVNHEVNNALFHVQTSAAGGLKVTLQDELEASITSSWRPIAREYRSALTLISCSHASSWASLTACITGIAYHYIPAIKHYSAYT